ncbi:Uncharacterized protein TCAP_06944 [Tolypocladium capitatum]|uniref:Uncharacterized protein n=1 Tax=Tolypocladium capitatum TaxID=45235 RepID=A0A2K3Q699_9HYPO|nr:Uncharacterized protein TCAP_06944 [Tolypocladium capitatum]
MAPRVEAVLGSTRRALVAPTPPLPSHAPSHHRGIASLGGLVPLGVDADQTAEGAGQADEAIVKVGEAQGGAGHDEIGEVDALALNDALAVLSVNLGLALPEPVEGVQLRADAEDEARGPEAEGLALDRLGALPLADAEGIGQGDGVKGEVAGVAELAAEGGVAQERVDGFCVGGDGGGLDVLDGLAEAQDLAGEAEVLLEGVPGGHLGGGAVGAQ